MIKNQSQKKYQSYHYILVSMIENGHRVIFSPDFDYRFTVPFNQDPDRYNAAALKIVGEEIQAKLKELDEKGEPHPVPKTWKDWTGRDEVFSVQEAAHYLKVSPSTLRRMDISFQETPGGHRRYLKKDLDNLL